VSVRLRGPPAAVAKHALDCASAKVSLLECIFNMAGELPAAENCELAIHTDVWTSGRVQEKRGLFKSLYLE